MKKIFFSSLLYISSIVTAQVTITEIGELPKRTSNNVVCEGFIGGAPYLYSFGGIDSTKLFSGIHLESFRYNVNTEQVMTLPQLPDTLGKIAMGISRIDDIIYITGGYHVYADGSEKSSDKVHRFDVTTNSFLSDGNPIPVATDDHVQAVWRDSLIYLITGWSDVGNIPDVQIYNPTEDSWLVGTDVPNSSYRSFGASGAIVGDTIYYFGGAYSSTGFNIQNKLRKGVINPNNPTEISWSISTPDAGINGYRMAATTNGNQVHWVGGSNKTYNYNGIAYDGSGGIEPNNRDLFISMSDDESFNENLNSADIPMDLRSIAKVSDTVQYIVGGMLSGQEVTNKIYKIEWASNNLSISNKENPAPFSIIQNNYSPYIQLYSAYSLKLHIYNVSGQKVADIHSDPGIQILSLSHLPSGIYFVGEKEGTTHYQKLILNK